jgi:hypothetical protein
LTPDHATEDATSLPLMMVKGATEDIHEYDNAHAQWHADGDKQSVGCSVVGIFYRPLHRGGLFFK